MDNVRQFISLRDQLVREKKQLEQRLQEINRALGQVDEAAATSEAPTAPARASSQGRARRGRPTKSGISLRDAVLQVTSGGPKTKEEILQGVKALGYKFSTNNPLNSLGVVLYGKNPKFKNEDGRFSPAGGSSSGGGSNSSGGAGAFGRKKRQLSPEARERIAAAQRERWAKSRK